MSNSPSVPSPSPSARAPGSGPWWKYGHMWMVVGGPLAVVVAGFVTLYLAMSHPDPVYSDADRGRLPADVASPTHGAGNAAVAPAMQARNHAATGGVAKPTATPAAALNDSVKP